MGTLRTGTDNSWFNNNLIVPKQVVGLTFKGHHGSLFYFLFTSPKLWDVKLSQFCLREDPEEKAKLFRDLYSVHQRPVKFKKQTHTHRYPAESYSNLRSFCEWKRWWKIFVDNLISTTRLKIYESCDELHFHGQKLNNHVKDIANELLF